MLYPSINKLVKQPGQCRYSLVIAVAKEARVIAERAEQTGETLPEKPIKMAVNAIAEGKASYKEADTN